MLKPTLPDSHLKPDLKSISSKPVVTAPVGRIGRAIYALIVGISLIVIGRNLYQRRLNEDLSMAVRTGSAAQVRSLLDRHADLAYKVSLPIENPRPQWYTLLGLSLYRLGDAEGALRRANVYLEAVSPPPGNSKTSVGTEAFHLDTQALKAQRDEAESITCLLINRGANLVPAPGEPSYLTLACQVGNLTVVRCLFSKEPSVDRLDPEQSALAAVLAFPRPGGLGTRRQIDRFPGGPNGNGGGGGGRNRAERRKIREEIVRLLREHGAHLTAEHAVALGDTGALRSILAQRISPDLGALLPTAAQRDDLETTRILLEHGADANLIKEGQESALCTAADRGNLLMVKLLLEHGADANREGMEGHLPLSAACRQGRIDIAELLLAHGARVNPSGQVMLPLRGAIWSQKPEMVRFLLAKGADVNQKDEVGLPLLTVAMKDMSAVVPDLLHRGALVNPPDTTEPAFLTASSRLPTTPLMAALWYAPQFEQTLLKAGATIGSDRHLVLVAAANQRRLDLFPKLLACGADINAVDIDGETPLTQAIMHTPAGVPMLLADGADPNIVTHAQRTPLQLAALTGNVEAIRLLIAHHVDVNRQPPRGHTALFYARKHNHTEIIALLEAAGAHSDMP